MAEESRLTQRSLEPLLNQDDLDAEVNKPYTGMHTT